LSDDFTDEEQTTEEPMDVVVEIPIVETGTFLYVCEQCGGNLTEIPYYNRYLCENCELHY